jgi:soluble lytic murein transglycosylase-like protein
LNMFRPGPVLLATLTVIGIGPQSASAELVFFTSGRAMSVKEVRNEGETVVLVLRNGGEIVCDRGLITRVEVDEVPYPEVQTAEGSPSRSEDRPTARLEVPDDYRALVATLAGNHGVDVGLVHAVIAVESAYQPRARSRKGAKGLMQLMPVTARQYGVRNAYSPEANLDAGIKHLRSLLDRFDVTLALAAYNAGEAAVRRFGGIPPYRETREYVTRVLELARSLGFAAVAAQSAPRE